MKKILHYLAMAIVCPLLLVACSKEKATNSGGGSTPLPIPTPSITWTVSPTDIRRGDTSFYKEVKILTITVLNADSFGIVGASGSLVTTGQITSPVTYTAIAKNSVGARITSIKTLSVYSETKTNIVGGIQGVKWGEDSIFVADIPDSLSNPLPSDWAQSGLALDQSRYQYFTNNNATVFIPSGPAAGTYPNNYYALVMPENVPPYNETHMMIPGIGLRRIETATPTKLVFTERIKITNGTGFKIFRFVYSPKP